MTDINIAFKSHASKLNIVIHCSVNNIIEIFLSEIITKSCRAATICKTDVNARNNINYGISRRDYG